ncbi:MAG: DUF2905 domain-containing protein [Dehalococcoidia bacterium]|nr:DUF2905 domain-containing protein [Dehalococcoidia bacterium]
MALIGAVLLIVGVALWGAGRFTGLGRLPGDIVIQRDGFSCFVPIVSMIVVSVVLTVILNIVVRLLNRGE